MSAYSAIFRFLVFETEDMDLTKWRMSTRGVFFPKYFKIVCRSWRLFTNNEFF